MSELTINCIVCGKPLSARTQERGFKRCYDCYLKANSEAK